MNTEQLKEAFENVTLDEDGLFYFDQAVDSFFEQNVLKNIVKDAIHMKLGSHNFIPFPADQFVYLLDNAIAHFMEANDERKPISFIDLGCGIGNIMRLAQKRGLEVSGVEFDEDYANLAKQLLPRGNIMKDDLRKWMPDKTYDIPYFYKPFSRDVGWIAWMNRFVNTFPKGQIFITSHDIGIFTTPSSQVYIPQLKELSPSIYQIV